MTERERERKSIKFRRIAGSLYVELRNPKLPGNIRDHISIAHKAMCKAFMAMEKTLCETDQ